MVKSSSENNIYPECEGREIQFFRQLDAVLGDKVFRSQTQSVGVLVLGASGIGKSYLIHQYLENSAFELIISSQSHQPQDIPYSTIKNSLGVYLRAKVKGMDSGSFSEFSSGIRNLLGDDLVLLADYLPELTLLIPDPESPGIQFPKVENQLYPLFLRFFDYLTGFFGKPILWFIDDFQWVDGSSANLIQYLLANLSEEKLRWVGACRSGEKEVLPAKQLVASLGFFQKHIHVISLKKLNVIQAQQLLESHLNTPFEFETTKLLHSLAEGIPGSLLLMLETLVKEGMLTIQEGQYVGEKNTILDKYQGDQPEFLFLEKIKSLPPREKEMFGFVVCGQRLDLQELSKLMNIPLLEAENALNGLQTAQLVKREGDLILLPESYPEEWVLKEFTVLKKMEFHLKLAEIQMENKPVKISDKVIMAQHLQQAVGLITASDQKLEMAKLMLEVAKIQREEQSFAQAKSFLETVEELVKGVKWNEDRALLEQMMMERARVEYYLGEFDLAEIQLDQLIEYSPEPDTRFLAFELKLTVNNHLGRYRKSVVILEQVLQELGLNLPRPREIKKQISELQKLIEIERESGFPSDPDELKKQSKILKLFYIGGMALHHTSDLLMTWAALQIIWRSQFSKLPNVRSLGLVSYGRMKIIAGEIENGFDLGLNGLDLNTTIGDIRYRCRVLGVFGFYILPWKKGFAESFALLEEGMAVARKSGDLIGLYILKTHLFNLQFLSGKAIQELLKFDFKESYVGMELTFYITHYQKELIRYLTGESSFLSLPKQQARGMEARLTLLEEKFYRNYVLARYYFLFGYYSQALDCSQEADQNSKLQEGSPLVPANLILKSLSITQNWGNQSPETFPAHLDWLWKTLIRFEQWNLKSPDNYASDYWLLKAELARINFEAADEIEAYYLNSIQRSENNPYQKALAHELFAKYFLANQQTEDASTHLQQALFHYNQWGAVRKTEQLIHQYSFLIPEDAQKREGWDIETILLELAGEIEPAQISQSLLVILMRVSASTFAMIQWVDPDGELKGSSQNQLFAPKEGEELQQNLTPLNELFRMAHRTKSPMVFNEWESIRDFPELQWVRDRGGKSCLFFPVGFSENKTMVVYLESGFSSQVFSEEIIRWVRIVARQGGVILDNAKNYENMLRLNEEVRQEMEQRQDLMALLEKQKDAHIKDLIKVQEYERERIASELHDSLGSQLSTLKLNLAHLFEEEEGGELMTSNGLNALSKLDEAIDEVRRIARNMSPVSLLRFGLESAVQDMLENLAQNSNIKIDLQFLGLQNRLEAQLELTIYRICQELIQNALKHSGADQLRLQMIHHGDSLNFSLEDNGIGIQKPKEHWGMGLLGIETKVQMLNGYFHIESKKGEGCLVIVDIPLQNES